MARIADIKPVLDGFCRALVPLGIRSGKVYLFGSWSRGEQGEASDIDVAVVSPDFASMDYWARIEALAEAVAAVRAPIEAIAFTPEEFLDGDRPIAHVAAAGMEIDLGVSLAAENG